jgi:hypothetical protein
MQLISLPNQCCNFPNPDTIAHQNKIATGTQHWKGGAGDRILSNYRFLEYLSKYIDVGRSGLEMGIFDATVRSDPENII